MVEYLENWAGLEVIAITAMHSEMCKESFNWERLQTSPAGQFAWKIDINFIRNSGLQ